MGFLDDLKKGANDLGNSISGTVGNAQSGQKASNLLHDLGALTWAAKVGQGGPNDSEEWARIEAELTQLAADGTVIDLKLKTSAAPPPPPPGPAAEAPAPPPADAPAAPTPPPAPDAPAAAAAPPAAAAAPPAPAPPPAPDAPAAPAAPAGGSFTLDDL